VLVAFAIGTNELLIKPWVEASGTGSGSSAPVGSLMPYAGTAAPGNWLMCSGQTVSRSTYVDLFNVVSTTFGAGDGSTTFNVPDMRGRFPLGIDNMDGVSADRVTDSQADSLGGFAGVETVGLTAGQMPAHTHSLGTVQGSEGGFDGTPPRSYVTGTRESGSEGLDMLHDNMSPFLSLNYIIKY